MASSNAELFLNTQNYSGSTRRNYRSTISKYFPTYGDLTFFADLELAEAIEWIKTKSKTDKDKTLNEHFNRIRKYLSWEIEKDHITLNYPLNNLFHKYINNANPIIIDDLQIKIATDSMSPEEKATFYAYLDTGVRKEEISQLKPIHFIANSSVRVYGSKTHTERTVHAVSDRVRSLVESEDISSFVRPHILVDRFKEILEKNEIKITFDILRHTFATNYIEQGGNIMYLANMMGNSPEVILKNYCHRNDKLTKEETSIIINKKENLRTLKAELEYLRLRVKELEGDKE